MGDFLFSSFATAKQTTWNVTYQRLPSATNIPHILNGSRHASVCFQTLIILSLVGSVELEDHPRSANSSLQRNDGITKPLLQYAQAHELDVGIDEMPFQLERIVLGRCFPQCCGVRIP